MTGPRILFSGYFGFNNFGDDAILYCMAQQFKKMLPDAQLSVLTQDIENIKWLYDVDTKESFGAYAYRRMKPADILRAIKNCDLFISGGGGIFQDTTSVKSVMYYAGLIYLALKFKKKVMIFSQGLGPFRNPVSRKIVSFVLRHVHDATFRDEASVALAKTLSGRDFEYAADPVFLLEPSGEKADAPIFFSFIENQKWRTHVGLFLRDWYRGAFHENLHLLMEKFIKDGAAFAYLSFQPKDLLLIKENSQPYFCRDAVACFPPDVFSFYEKLDVCLCMRYHSAVCAFLAGKPALGFSYDPKVRGLFNDFGLSEFCLPLDATSQDMISCYEKLLKNKDGVVQKINAHLPAMKERALKSFTLARRMV